MRVLREATNVSIYCGANFPCQPLSVSSSRSHNLRQSSVMFDDNKRLGGTALWREGEMKGLVICFWVVKMWWSTQSCHCLSPVADGDLPSACLHLICVHVCWLERGREREAAGLKARCEGARVKQVLN